jgi:predicted DNA binding protein
LGAFQVYSYSRVNLHRVVDSIKSTGGEVAVESIHPMEMGMWESLLPASSIMAGLTSKQIRAISEALALGYFEEPSRISAAELASRLGVSRSTLSEHLRKAERKIPINIFSSIRLQDLE